MTPTNFPAADFIRDIRAAGGSIELADDGYALSCARDSAAVNRVERSYFAKMNADPDYRARICEALEAEAGARSTASAFG
jgi:hypothetical protein